MSEKLCPAGCGYPHDLHQKDAEHCPWVTAWLAFRQVHLQEAPLANTFADEHWREYWTPKVGDWVIDETIAAQGAFKIEKTSDGYIEVEKTSGSKAFFRPATPKEVESAQGAKEEFRGDIRNLKRIRELTGVSLETATHLLRSFKMESGAKYLSRGGEIVEVLCRYPNPSPGYDFQARFGSKTLKTALDENGRLWSGQDKPHDLLCRIYERGEKYFVTTGEKRRVRAGEWVLGNTSRTPKHADRGDDGYEYDILQQIHIQAAGPASASSPEPRKDPTPRPAEPFKYEGKKYVATTQIKGGDEIPPGTIYAYEREISTSDGTTSHMRGGITTRRHLFNPDNVGGKPFYYTEEVKEEKTEDRAKLQRVYGALVGVKIGDHLVYRGEVFVAKHDLYASQTYRFACPDEIKKFQEREKAAAAAKAPVTQQDASSGKASTLVAPAAQLLPTWLDGDCEAYMSQAVKFCPSTTGEILREWLAANEEAVEITARLQASIVTKGLIKLYGTDDPSECLRLQNERDVRDGIRFTRAWDNRYQYPFDLTAWIHRSM